MKLFSTSCETLFLGWDAPLLPRAVETLRDRFASSGEWKLANMDCVLPSAHGVRRMHQLLQAEAAQQGLRLERPRIMTIGQLPDRLYQPPSPIALEFEQTLAWARALREIEPEQLSPLIPVAPPAEPLGPWLELAGTLRSLHEELAASRLAFADVKEFAETDAERRRWDLLQEIHHRYARWLDQAGLCDPFIARRQAVLSNRCRTDRMVVLIGTSDLSDAMVELLRALDSKIIAMVAAPERESARFDEFGCVDTASWLRHRLPLEDRTLVAAGDMLDQSVAVAETVGLLAGDHSPDQITVGVTDESQVGPIELELRGCGVATYRHLGWALAETAIGRLFQLTAQHLQRRTWQSLAALVRHADVHAWVTRQFADQEDVDPKHRDHRHAEDWLVQLDQLLAEHFPIRITDPLPQRAVQRLPLAHELGQRITEWLSCFDAPPQGISAWSRIVSQWLGTIYGDQWQVVPAADRAPEDRGGREQAGDEQGVADRSRGRTWLALQAAGRLLQRFSDLNERLDVRSSGDVAIEMLSARLAEVRVLEQPRPEQIEILGWLDLALDDAPALVVNGLNHPFVPRVVTSDPFLPGTLRTRLPMADNDRRFARDVYAMQLMLKTRRAVRFIVGSSAADQSPTPPSRLLAAAEPRDIARRVRLLLSQSREPQPVLHHWDQQPDRPPLGIPPLVDPRGLPLDAKSDGGKGTDVGQKTDVVKTLSVTAFRDYLICPYRFYLRHVLKLRPLDDSATELAANQFGDLIHGALERYGLSEHKQESDPDKIETWLKQFLHEHAEDLYSQYASTAVQIQVAQAERRLKAVARAQAKRFAEGWRIDQVEASVGPEQNARIEVGGQSVIIKGRFDRIDVRRVNGQESWAILDYKTHGHPPEKKHLQKTDQGYRWIDLQLPLYRMMIPYLGIQAEPSTVKLGYFNISEKDEETRVNEASFTEELMQQAEALIRDCVRRILAGDFAPTHDRVEYDDYDMILQTGVASRMLDQAARSSGEEAEI